MIKLFKRITRTIIFSRLRKQVKSGEYIKSRLKLFSEKSFWWERFYTFKCDDYFVGEYMAHINRLKFNKEGKRCMKKCEWYKRKYNEVNL